MIHALHGAVGMADDWKELLPEARMWNLWTLLGKGEISLAEAGELIATEAQDGDALIGYSMGGRLALHALLSKKCQWGSAVIISAHPGLKDGRAARLESDQKWASLAENDWSLFLEKWNAQSVLSGPNPDWPDRAELLSHQHEVAKSFRCWSLGSQEDLRLRLSEITCPVRWVVGEQDKKFTKLAREAVPLILNASLEVIPGVGHRVPWEKKLFSQS